ncbi:1-alkyl-2-acetylglycerophosphocholine esterase [Synchytrium microbalum]|uniref:Putative phospholipase n=1 Tax=Synchytrium microbalum TaxID=1806994 RepID=A0A507BKP9_9FUNG|nr:1-alkyl-2-acetylglycerophosphocholine esterase [Synchytrium microbalum]TPX31030.1 1-alkyl-2-acetylglycerophosphocholine esterase [Synchytrium microbalum]
MSLIHVWPRLPFKYHGKHPVSVTDIENEHVLTRWYYPATSEGDHPGIAWLPSRYHAFGLGHFLKLSKFASFPIYQYLWTFNSPVARDAPVANLFCNSGDSVKLPVVIFSHGLAGNRSMYSSLCGDLASRGFVVVALEHKDGSACAYVGSDEKPILYQRPVGNDDELLAFRRKQVEERSQDVKYVLEMLHNLNAGTPVENKMTRKISTFEQKGFQNKLSLDNMVMMGHSFGAATAITVLQQTNNFKCGVLLDSWCYAIEPTPSITVPMLSVNSETFHWPENLQSLQHVLSGGNPNNTFVTLRGTGHQDASDMPSLVPHVLLKYMGRSISADPCRALDMQSVVITEFLRRNLGMSGVDLPDYSSKIKDLARKDVVLGIQETYFKGLL